MYVFLFFNTALLVMVASKCNIKYPPPLSLIVQSKQQLYACQLKCVHVQDPELSALSPPGIQLQLHDQPHTLLDSFFYISGHIPRVTPYEAGNPNHASQWVSAQQLFWQEWTISSDCTGKGTGDQVVWAAEFIVLSVCCWKSWLHKLAECCRFDLAHRVAAWHELEVSVGRC
jgi:hypothetical protein